MKERVLVGMSGGIDSSAVCLMLQEQGYEPVGLTMRVWDLSRHFTEPGQTLPGFILEARALAERLGMEHYVADEREEFRQVVVRDFVDEYLAGCTPNPCVMCNPRFKFRVLCEWADKLGCSRIATGHYVSTTEVDGRPVLRCGIDGGKDQSYFLWRLGYDVLKRAIFPLGHLHKAEVRAYLEARGFAAKAREGESMEVCFIEGDYRDFLRTQVPDWEECVRPGLYVDTAGRPIGRHQGHALYTIGQRKGLGIALGKPAFVVKINAMKNTVMLGSADDLLTRHLLVEGAHWHGPFGPDTPGLSVRVRYRSKPIPCTVRHLQRWELQEGEMEISPLFLVTLDTPASAITPGQSAVFYQGDLLAGGALIASQRGLQHYLKDLSIE